jgi:hypothetical protein
MLGPAILLTLAAATAPAPAPTRAAATVDATTAERFATLVLGCVHRPYPNKIAHVLTSDADALPPRELTPAFDGCFDWHSAVHGHWLLVRLLRLYPDAPFAGPARAALGKSLTNEHIQAEVHYLASPARPEFERPYGLAWLLRLAADLRQWDDSEGRQWAATLAPLERAAADRLKGWLPKLSYPIREGEHNQTAFAFGLVADWARVAGDEGMTRLIAERTRTFYFKDRNCPLSYEPSGQDFLSPCLEEAELVRRFMAPAEYAAWLGAFLPDIPRDGRGDWLTPAVVTDPTDGKLAHMDGLNLSRAWSLEAVAAALPAGDPRIAALRAAAAQHRASGLAAVTGAHYEGSHWLGTFAVYLVTEAWH